MIRKKSVKVPYRFGNVSDIASDATASVGTQSIFIPENTYITVTFSSAQLFIAYQDVSVGGVTIFGMTTSIFLNSATGGNTASMFLGNGTMPNSGENMGGLIGPIDYTQFFQQGYGVSSSSTLSNITVRFSGTGLTARGIYAYMDITYLYDDSTPIRTNTISIPYQSPTSSLTSSVVHFSVIPNLSGTNGLLNGYSSSVVRYRWLEVKGNCNNNNIATLHNLSYRFDTGGSSSLPARYSAAASDTWQMYHIDMSTYSTSATYSFQLWNLIPARWSNIIVSEWIVYEYSVLGTTYSLNYIELPVDFSSPISSTSSRPTRFLRSFNIQEPNVNIKEAALEINYTTDVNTGIYLRVGSQSYIPYTNIANVVCGQYSLQHKINNTTFGSTGISLQRGSNSAYIDLYTFVGTASTVSGKIKLLYESGVSSMGIDSHTKTLTGFQRNMSFTASFNDFVQDNFLIPETTYYINSAAVVYHYWVTTSSAANPIYINNRVSVESFDYNTTDTWVEISTDSISGDAELQYICSYARYLPYLRQYPSDYSDKLSLTQSRWYRNTLSSPSRYGTSYLVSYHTINYQVSGTIYGSRGSTVSIYLYQISTASIPITYGKSSIYSFSQRSGNGTFSFTVYDDTTQYQIVAYESSNRKGSSKISGPTNSFNLILLENQTYGFGG